MEVPLISHIHDANFVAFIQAYKALALRTSPSTLIGFEAAFSSTSADEASALLGSRVDALSLLDYALMQLSHIPKKSIKYRNVLMIAKFLLEVSSFRRRLALTI